MIFREAKVTDIDGYMKVSMAVKENVIMNPALVPREDNIAYLTLYGKGWVCEVDSKIVGFSIVGLIQKNVWALFVSPDYEELGIGSALHDIMVDWYFSQTSEKIRLDTKQNTNAAVFFERKGWTKVGLHDNDNIKFEITREEWNKYNNKKLQSFAE